MEDSGWLAQKTNITVKEKQHGPLDWHRIWIPKPYGSWNSDLGLVKLAGQGESGGGCDGLSSWCPGRIWLELVVKVQRQVGMYLSYKLFQKKMAFLNIYSAVWYWL